MVPFTDEESERVVTWFTQETAALRVSRWPAELLGGTSEGGISHMLGGVNHCPLTSG